jgi:hypothetical protein
MAPVVGFEPTQLTHWFWRPAYLSNCSEPANCSFNILLITMFVNFFFYAALLATVWTMKRESIYAQPFFHSSICKPVVAIRACKMPYYFFYGFKHCRVFSQEKRRRSAFLIISKIGRTRLYLQPLAADAILKPGSLFPLGRAM